MSQTHRVRFAVYRNGSGQWGWRATRAGHVIAQSDTEGHARRSKALEAVQKLVDAIEQKQYVVIQPDDLLEE